MGSDVRGRGNVTLAPPAKNEFFTVNELRSNSENYRTNSYKLRNTNCMHENHKKFLDGGGRGVAAACPTQNRFPYPIV